MLNKLQREVLGIKLKFESVVGKDFYNAIDKALGEVSKEKNLPIKSVASDILINWDQMIEDRTTLASPIHDLFSKKLKAINKDYNIWTDDQFDALTDHLLMITKH